MFQTCSGCGSRFVVGFLRCPRCQAVAPLFAGRVKEEAVPKATVNSGVSNAGVAVGIRGERGPELVEMPEGAPVVSAADYASMTQAALREEAKARSLPVGGSKADLAARLNDHDQQAATAADDNAAQAAEQSGATA